MDKLTQSQDNLSKEEQLILKQDKLLVQMVRTRGFKEVFKPFLMDKLNQSFPDPSQFKDETEFTYAAKVTSVYKKVLSELFMWLDSKEAEMNHLLKKEKGELPEDNFRIGGDL